MKDPYTDIEFEKKHIVVKNIDGAIVLDEYIEFPTLWRYNDCKIVAEKYLCNRAKNNKELSVKDMFNRVSNTITEWGKKFGYFESDEDAEEFNYKLKYYQIRQYFAFNSPVYFNVGDRENAQASACFILSIEDNMDSITNVFHIEGRIFKQGSGSGINYSPLRSSKEKVAGGGLASGSCSFLKAHDCFAGVIKSGGRLRRSAKMALLNIDHPDIYEWITCKKKEEEKLKALIEAGVIDANDIRNLDEVYYQNTNLSVRITDDFMKAVLNKDKWQLRYVTTGKVYKEVDAYDLLKQIAESVWRSGEPGVQFHDTINKENTCKGTMTINASNPCSEYMWCDNSSCNLASINVLKCYDPKTESFDIKKFCEIVDLVITAQDIIVDGATYPTKEIEENTKKYRALGLGYTNMGALLMRMRIPYNSYYGRCIAKAITALMQAQAIETSSNLAKKYGCYEKFYENNNSAYHREVLERQYKKHLIPFYEEIKKNNHLSTIISDILYTAKAKYAIHVINTDDFVQRNSQLTLLAPTGTISFVMGAETTGIEPDYSIVKYKTMSDTGETVQIVNELVEPTLKNLEFDNKTIKTILEKFKSELIASKIDELGDFKEIFYNSHEIHYKDHLRMLAAVQPFLSGSISKTVNVPSDITVEELIDLYIYSWKLGLKSVIVYRDSSKNFQVLTTNRNKQQDDSKCEEPEELDIEEDISDEDDIMKQYNIILRRKLPDDVEGGRHKFRIGDFKGYLNYSVFPETNQLAEFFVNISKQGTTISGLLDALATTASIAFQYGLPLKVWVQKMLYQKFDPAGFTSNKDIKFATSVVDYFAKYLGKKFLTLDEQYEIGLISNEEYYYLKKGRVFEDNKINKNINGEKCSFSGAICPNCGSMMRRLGTCDFCDSCGFNSGSCS
jgi:ribonucleoside-diphosphate reductase alpha chain